MIFAGTGGISRHIRENFAPEQGVFSALIAFSPAATGALAFSPFPL
jgi:hypothetical protein